MYGVTSGGHGRQLLFAEIPPPHALNANDGTARGAHRWGLASRRAHSTTRTAGCTASGSQDELWDCDAEKEMTEDVVSKLR